MTTRMFWAMMLATTCLLPGALQADGELPADPNVIAGDITISNPTPAQLLLMQSSIYGIVDWGSFSIADGFGVQFQNGTGATLNRVTGSDLSAQPSTPPTRTFSMAATLSLPVRVPPMSSTSVRCHRSAAMSPFWRAMW